MISHISDDGLRRFSALVASITSMGTPACMQCIACGEWEVGGRGKASIIQYMQGESGLGCMGGRKAEREVEAAATLVNKASPKGRQLYRGGALKLDPRPLHL